MNIKKYSDFRNCVFCGMNILNNRTKIGKTWKPPTGKQDDRYFITGAPQVRCSAWMILQDYVKLLKTKFSSTILTGWSKKLPKAATSTIKARAMLE